MLGRGRFGVLQKEELLPPLGDSHIIPALLRPQPPPSIRRHHQISASGTIRMPKHRVA
jgi:hypothetical protein